MAAEFFSAVVVDDIKVEVFKSFPCKYEFVVRDDEDVLVYRSHEPIEIKWLEHLDIVGFFEYVTYSKSTAFPVKIDKKCITDKVSCGHYQLYLSVPFSGRYQIITLNHQPFTSDEAMYVVMRRLTRKVDKLTLLEDMIAKSMAAAGGVAGGAAGGVVGGAAGGA
jgi:hypothetical protein